MAKTKIRFGEDEQLLIKPTERLAILWSFNPKTRFYRNHEMVGSVYAHMGHLDLYGAVYWTLVFKVSQEILDEFEYPMSGYLYNSELQVVQYRTRVLEMTSGVRKNFSKFVPMWRSKDLRDNLYILIDHIDELLPYRCVSDFKFYETKEPVKSPSNGNYFKVLDPLF